MIKIIATLLVATGMLAGCAVYPAGPGYYHHPYRHPVVVVP